MTDTLRSPTCRDCARNRGLRVPGDIHTCWEGECANCGATGPVSPASDWRKPNEPIHPEAWD